MSNHEDEIRIARHVTRRDVLRTGLTAGAGLSLPGLLAACGGGDSGGGGGDSGGTPATSVTGATGEPVRGGRLRTGHVGGGSNEQLNPFQAPNFIDVGRARQLYEKLYELDDQLRPTPVLAESLEANADSTVWRLKLRSGVVFHDGKPLTADDVIYSWRKAATKEYESASKVEPFDFKRTRSVSKTEVELHLKRPIGDMQSIFANKVMYIISDGLEDFEQPNGTGPFKFVSWKRGERSLFQRNERYWRDGQPYFDELEMISIPDESARLNALLGDQIDAMEQLSFTQARAQESSPEVAVLRGEAPFVVPMYMRLDVPPFDDPRVREAFRLAIDREQTVEVAFAGFGRVGNDLIGLGYPSYNSDLPQRAYDPERARALLKEAGHEGLRVTLPTSTVVPGTLESATAFKQQAAQAGIEVTLQRLPNESYYDTSQKYLSKAAPFYQTNWGAASFESQAVDGLVKGAPYNETAWNDARWSAEFAQAQAISDPDQRNAAYKKLQEPLHERGGYIVWGFSDYIDGVSKKLGGVTASPVFNLGHYGFKDWWRAS